MEGLAVMVIGGIVRHVLTMGGAVAAFDAQSQAQQIAGAVVALGAVCWSAYQKWKAARA